MRESIRLEARLKGQAATWPDAPTFELAKSHDSRKEKDRHIAHHGALDRRSFRC